MISVDRQTVKIKLVDYCAAVGRLSDQGWRERDKVDIDMVV